MQTNLHTRLASLATYVSVLATLSSPDAVIALAYGVPSVETEQLARFLDERRLAA